MEPFLVCTIVEPFCVSLSDYSAALSLPSARLSCSTVLFLHRGLLGNLYSFATAHSFQTAGSVNYRSP